MKTYIGAVIVFLISIFIFCACSDTEISSESTVSESEPLEDGSSFVSTYSEESTDDVSAISEEVSEDVSSSISSEASADIVSAASQDGSESADILFSDLQSGEFIRTLLGGDYVINVTSTSYGNSETSTLRKHGSEKARISEDGSYFMYRAGFTYYVDIHGTSQTYTGDLVPEILLSDFSNISFLSSGTESIDDVKRSYDSYRFTYKVGDISLDIVMNCYIKNKKVFAVKCEGFDYFAVINSIGLN